jgi:hypothetical protein
MKTTATRLVSAGAMAALLVAGVRGQESLPVTTVPPTPSPTVPPPASATRGRPVDPALRDAIERSKRGAAELLEKALAGLGGASRVDSVKTLMVKSKQWTRTSEGPLETSRMTYYQFPNSYRSEVTMGKTTVATIVNSEGAFLSSAAGAIQLSQAQRGAVERSITRDPLILLKTRRDRAFLAEPGGAGSVAGRPVHFLRIKLVFDTTTLAVDDRDGRVLQIDYTTRGGSPEKEGTMKVAFSDFRAIQGLAYPFLATGVFNGEKVLESRIESVELDKPVAPVLFAVPPVIPGTASTPTPTAVH